jgi:uncharacterized protein (DUF488 family)
MTMQLITVRHGTSFADAFAQLLRGVRVSSLVDARSALRSRSSAAFYRSELETWLSGVAVSYRWEPRLGGSTGSDVG